MAAVVASVNESFFPACMVPTRIGCDVRGILRGCIERGMCGLGGLRGCMCIAKMMFVLACEPTYWGLLRFFGSELSKKVGFTDCCSDGNR